MVRMERRQPTVALRPRGTEVMERSELQPPVTNGDPLSLELCSKTPLPVTIKPVSSRRILWGGDALLSVVTIHGRGVGTR